MHGKRLSEEDKGRIVGAIQSGLSFTQTADILNFSIATIQRTWLHYCETGSTHYENHAGRPKKLDIQEHMDLVGLARVNRRVPLCELGLNIHPQVSRSTVRKELNSEHIHRRRAHKKPTLKEYHKAGRLRFALEMLAKENSIWEHVIWSDESYFVIGGSRGAVYVSRLPCEEYDEDCTVPSDEQPTARVMIWACIMKNCKGPIVALDYPGGRGGGMTADRYVEQVLDPVLTPFYREMSRQRGDIFFQQDGARCHAARKTQQCLQRNTIAPFPHPSKSPDLSPVEPVWHDLKEVVRLRHENQHISTSEELKEVVIDAWNSLSITKINSYVGRMPKALCEVLERNGAMTGY